LLVELKYTLTMHGPMNVKPYLLQYMCYVWSAVWVTAVPLRSLYRIRVQVNLWKPYAQKCHLVECTTIRQVISKYGKLCRYILHHSTYTNIRFTQ